MTEHDADASTCAIASASAGGKSWSSGNGASRITPIAYYPQGENVTTRNGDTYMQKRATVARAGRIDRRRDGTVGGHDVHVDRRAPRRRFQPHRQPPATLQRAQGVGRVHARHAGDIRQQGRQGATGEGEREGLDLRGVG